MVHESDLATEVKFKELGEIMSIINQYYGQCRICQKDINRLNMIATPDKNTDGSIIYKLPNNIAGNEIDPDYRISQKEALIVNVDKLLAELNGFLANE